MIEPSGIFCSSCTEEIDLFDGPIRMVGEPKAFPFCWKCLRELYSADFLSVPDIVAEKKEDGRLYITMKE